MAKFVMPTVTFVEDYEPTTTLGRTAEDNPFNEVVAALISSWDDSIKRSKGAVKLVIPPEDTRTQVTHKFGRAANAAGFSPRFEDKANESFDIEGDKVSLGVVMAYLVPLITRTRKSKTLVITHVSDKVSLIKEGEAVAV